MPDFRKRKVSFDCKKNHRPHILFTKTMLIKKRHILWIMLDKHPDLKFIITNSLITFYNLIFVRIQIFKNV